MALVDLAVVESDIAVDVGVWVISWEVELWEGVEDCLPEMSSRETVPCSYGCCCPSSVFCEGSVEEALLETKAAKWEGLLIRHLEADQRL